MNPTDVAVPSVIVYGSSMGCWIADCDESRTIVLSMSSTARPAIRAASVVSTLCTESTPVPVETSFPSTFTAFDWPGRR